MKTNKTFALIRISKKRGMALILALVFATVLLQMAVAYSSLTQASQPQTLQIDERIKLEYLAHGLTELALLKLQLYPGDFYAAWDAFENFDDPTWLNQFTINAEEFTIQNFALSKSTFSDRPISIQLASMAVYTNNRWKEEAIFIQAEATYQDRLGRNIAKDAIRIIAANRHTLR